jgi:hypothetical protein
VRGWSSPLWLSYSVDLFITKAGETRPSEMGELSTFLNDGFFVMNLLERFNGVPLGCYSFSEGF